MRTSLGGSFGGAPSAWMSSPPKTMGVSHTFGDDWGTSGEKKYRENRSRSWNFFRPTLTCIYKQNAHERCDFQFTFYHVPRCGVWLFWDKNDPTSVFLSPTQSQMKFFEKATNALKKLFRVFHLKLFVCVCVINYSIAMAFIGGKEAAKTIRWKITLSSASNGLSQWLMCIFALQLFPILFQTNCPSNAESMEHNFSLSYILYVYPLSSRSNSHIVIEKNVWFCRAAR